MLALYYRARTLCHEGAGGLICLWLSAVDDCGFARACRGLFPDQSVADVDAGRKSAFKLNSVGAQFRTQLKGLMGILTECQPHYVRCVCASLSLCDSCHVTVLLQIVTLSGLPACQACI